jgi:hypothetical protein
MKKAFSLLLLSLAGVFLAGCHFIPEEELFNNTGDDLIVITTTWVDGKARGATDAVSRGQAVRLGVPFRLEVRRRGSTSDYDVGRIPYDFYGSVGGNRRLASLQIQRDDSIYLLAPGSIAPAANLPLQPKGYPLKPK